MLNRLCVLVAVMLLLFVSDICIVSGKWRKNFVSSEVLHLTISLHSVGEVDWITHQCLK